MNRNTRKQIPKVNFQIACDYKVNPSLIQSHPVLVNVLFPLLLTVPMTIDPQEVTNIPMSIRSTKEQGTRGRPQKIGLYIKEFQTVRPKRPDIVFKKRTHERNNPFSRVRANASLY